ncbi:hypothetical protein TNCV_1001371 [Trichonephila clavipes]|nr:hypothetical protein TNCV_1001371 [Trichonephila clavipes]
MFIHINRTSEKPLPQNLSLPEPICRRLEPHSHCVPYLPNESPEFSLPDYPGEAFRKNRMEIWSANLCLLRKPPCSHPSLISLMQLFSLRSRKFQFNEPQSVGMPATKGVGEAQTTTAGCLERNPSNGNEPLHIKLMKKTRKIAAGILMFFQNEQKGCL